MFRPQIFSLILTGLLLSAILGCSGGGNPISAPNNLDTLEPKNPTSAQALIGVYEVVIDPATLEAEVVPIRGAEFVVNVTNFLQPPSGNPANLGVKINQGGTSIPEGIIDLDVSITHPFPNTNFRGFDTRGILLGLKGTQLSSFDYDIQYPKVSETRLMNADGYTRWWNAVEFLTPGLFGYTPTFLGSGNPKATLNGYKYFCDDLGPNDTMDMVTVENRGTFSTIDTIGDPNTLTRQYVIKFPLNAGVPQIKFQYAVCASFLGPDPGSPKPAPVDDYPIEANTPEAYNISVVMQPESTIYYNPSQAGGDLLLKIGIYDWQALENPAGIGGEVNDVWLESPTLFPNPIELFSNGTLLMSENQTASVWEIEITDVTPESNSDEILISARSKDPTTYAPPGISIYPGAAVLSGYSLFTLDIPENTPPEVGKIKGPNKYAPGVSLEYKIGKATDIQDGPNVFIDWDFDGDGIFADDEDGSNTDKSGSYAFPGPGEYTIQCRVTDTIGAYTDSETFMVSPISIPYIDNMDSGTAGLWTVENGLFGTHDPSPPLEWNQQEDFWGSGDPTSPNYSNYMNTMLQSPVIPAGTMDTATLQISHRYDTESGFDSGQIYYKLNGGPWTVMSGIFEGTSPGYPAFQNWTYEVGGLSEGDLLQFGFQFESDSSVATYDGWDVTYFQIIDNQPPEITEIQGPTTPDTLGPIAYTTVATDLDGIASYMWSLESSGTPPVYDDPGDSMGHFDAYFPADGNYWIEVEVTDAGDPPLSATFGPYEVSVFSINDNAFYQEDFSSDTGDWAYAGGLGDGSYQDFWHIDLGMEELSNLGADDCYAEHSGIDPPLETIEKKASVSIIFPDSTVETHLKLVHTVNGEPGGGVQPYDGQWVTLDGNVIDPTFGYLYSDNGGSWPHGYFSGDSGFNVISTWVLGTDYNDGLPHTLTFHQYSSDTTSNCYPPYSGWQVTYIEAWLFE